MKSRQVTKLDTSPSNKHPLVIVPLRLEKSCSLFENMSIVCKTSGVPIHLEITTQ